jgi:hypothetical protein
VGHYFQNNLRIFWIKAAEVWREISEINVPNYYFQYGSSWPVLVGNLPIPENRSR